MTDREKAMKGLECCTHGVDQCSICPYDPRSKDLPVDCMTDLATDALALIEEEYTTRLMPFDELMESKGMGWAEVWFRADEETEESKELFEIVFIGPRYICADGDTGCVAADTYNTPYHTRIWSGVDAPTNEQREAEPWN